MVYSPELWSVGGLAASPGLGSPEQDELVRRLLARDQAIGEQRGFELGGTLPAETAPTPTFEIGAGPTPIGGDVAAVPPAKSWGERISEFLSRPIGPDRAAVLGIASALSQFARPLVQASPEMAGLTGVASALVGGAHQAELRRRMLETLTGQTGQGPTEGPAARVFAPGGLDVLGLSPEQVAELYGTGMAIREKERQFPIAATKAIADAYQSIRQGDLLGAETELKNVQLAIAQAPVAQQMALLQKYADLQKALAGAAETMARAKGIEAETVGKEEETRIKKMFGPERAQAEIDRIRSETAQAKEAVAKSEWARTPAGMRALAEHAALEKRLGQPLHYINAGDRIVVYDPVSRRKIDEVPVGMPPEKVGVRDVDLMLKAFNQAANVIGGRYLQVAERDIIQRLGPERGAAEIANMRQMFGQSVIEGQANPWIIYGQLSPENRRRFETEFDQLRATLAAGGGPSALPTIQPPPPTPPTAPPQPGKPPVIEPATTPRAAGFTNRASAEMEARIRAGKGFDKLPRNVPIVDKRTGDRFVIDEEGNILVRSKTR